MNDIDYSQRSEPRPIDGGQVPQAIVEYMGLRLGAMTFRGSSGRSYRLGARPTERIQYVLNEDLGFFRARPDFRVLDETRIDPEAENLARIERACAERARQEAARILEQFTASQPPQPAPKPIGRPAGRGFGTKLDCWMTCGDLEGNYGGARAAYDAVSRYFSQHATPGEQVPPRERFPSVRSHAKRKREESGVCLWHKHSEPLPIELTSG